ncbi:MAG TPA: patatin-like phospholipase family protein, partial [candidate division Zixibacteria bacterium]|nr:patatin-like phospholipase family protein [candidate division Zixibacteria bacterium]
MIGGLDGLDPWAEEAGYPVLLALSGGGIRGLAGIGALRAFEETGIRVVAIAGTSMGGVVGGLYAAGYSPAELEEIVHG